MIAKNRIAGTRITVWVVANRLIEFLFDMDNYRGTGRLYLPS
jgi:hypothetical protein